MYDVSHGVKSPIGYLFTDIDSSTEKWERLPEEMRAALARHDALIDAIVARAGGCIEDRAGDGVFASFSAGNPLQCAIDIQLAMQEENWDAVGGLKIRVGVHCGADVGAPDKVNINRAARITATSWGGQIVISAAAVAAYGLPDRCELVDLGAHHLKGIDEPLRLFGLVHQDFQRRAFPPLRSASSRGFAVPAQTSPFYGRDRELAEISRRLSGDARLITIVGAGGNGKTRLALEIASVFSERMLVCVTALENVESSSALIGALATALRFPFSGAKSEAEQIVEYLRDKSALIVLDNADALVDEAHFLREVLGACQGLRLLLTRRAPLVVDGESVLRLQGLAPPQSLNDLNSASSSVLFVQSAKSARGDFELADGDFTAFREVCEAVEGSPLALHLLAQWTRLLSLREIAVEVRKGLALITERDAQSQQRLRRIFEGSWNLLAADQQEALAKLSIFTAAFDVPAALAVASVDLGALGTLERKCLLERREQQRFVMHPIIHQYAAEKLSALSGDRVTELRRRHSDYFLSLVQRLFAAARGAEQGHMLDLLQLEAANIRTAWAFAAAARDFTRMREAVEPLFYLSVLRTLYKDFAALHDVAIDDASLQNYVASTRANVLVHQSEPDRAEALAQHTLHGPADAMAIAHCHQALGNVAHLRGQFAVARVHYERALAERTGQGDTMGSYYSAISLAWLHLQSGNLAGAREWVKESYHLCQRMEHVGGMMAVHACAGDIAVQESRQNDALESYRQALKLERSVHHPLRAALINIKLGAIFCEMLRLEEAAQCFLEARDGADMLGDQRVSMHAQLGLGKVLRLQGRLEDAKARLQQALAQSRALSTKPQTAALLLELAQVSADEGEVDDAARLIALARYAGGAALQTECDGLEDRLGTDPAPPPAEAEFERALLELINERTFGVLRI